MPWATAVIEDAFAVVTRHRHEVQVARILAASPIEVRATRLPTDESIAFDMHGVLSPVLLDLDATVRPLLSPEPATEHQVLQAKRKESRCPLTKL